MGADLPASTILDFIIGDFEDAWDALAALPQPRHRANFMFARQAMTLLEVACRVCTDDPAGKALPALESELRTRDARYFSSWPAAPWQPKEFNLPGSGATLLSALFDLVRNGQAHQYQQIRATLSDGKDFQLAITGADHGCHLANALSPGRRRGHLKLKQDAETGDLWMAVYTDILFLDFRDAIRGSRVLTGSPEFERLSRNGVNKPGLYAVSSTSLATVLKAAGH